LKGNLSNYPTSIDTGNELYTVHDSLRLKLAEDYEPGDTFITVEPNPTIMALFPTTGIITLTEQCSEAELRAISFFYSGTTATTFTGLQLLPTFVDVAKPKRLTDVTQNVMAEHHNALKDALIAIEKFAGIKGEISKVPLKGTMEARINFLRKLVLQPKAWFTATKTVGVIPLCMTFKDFSTRQPNLWIWNFGDGTSSIISRTQPIMTGDVSKCYYSPGIYNVSLTVQNDFGENEIEIDNYISARIEAPDPATIIFLPEVNQISDSTSIRSRTNTLINILVNSSGQQPLDPIDAFFWSLGDDLNHDNTDSTIASYSVGGFYDVRLEADTELGAYRISTFNNVIDIVEQFSIWHFIFDPNAIDTAVTKNLYAYEFGLTSETYKVVTSSSISVSRNYNFLTGQLEQAQQVREFRRNNGFSPKNLTASGDQGNAVLFWAEGATNYTDSQVVRFREYNGFNDVWTTPVLGSGNDTISRRWNWFSLISLDTIYLMLGNTLDETTNQTITSMALGDYSITNTAFSNYQNGADELATNVGDGVDGDFSVYRSAWTNSGGFWVRNDGTGSFFRIKSFYGTSGSVSDPIQTIYKLTDMPGSAKFEGQMVTLTNGVYFFNNTGEVAVYNPTTNVWATGGPGVNSPLFAALQDKSVHGYSNQSNTLVATGDGDHKAYLSYDYSTKAFIKFNEVDLIFSSLPTRPSGEQFILGVY
jgi:hypothetical protein